MTTNAELTQAERDIVFYQVLMFLRRGVPPTITADDLTSAAYLGLMKARRRFDPKRGVKLATYAQRVVRGAIIDHYLKYTGARRKISNFESTPLSDAGKPASPHDEPETVAEQSHVRRAVAALPPTQRYVLVSYFWHGQKLPEIGAALGMSGEGAWYIKSQALKSLRDKWGSNDWRVK